MTLCIYPGLSSSDEVTTLLGINPTRAHDKGKPMDMPAGRIVKATTTAWLLSSDDIVESKDLRDHLNWLLGRLSDLTTEILTLQEEKGTKMCVSCTWISAAGHNGPVLWPEQMEALAKLNLECAFDFYFFGGGVWELEVEAPTSSESPEN